MSPDRRDHEHIGNLDAINQQNPGASRTGRQPDGPITIRKGNPRGGPSKASGGVGGGAIAAIAIVALVVGAGGGYFVGQAAGDDGGGDGGDGTDSGSLPATVTETVTTEVQPADTWDPEVEIRRPADGVQRLPGEINLYGVAFDRPDGNVSDSLAWTIYDEQNMIVAQLTGIHATWDATGTNCFDDYLVVLTATDQAERQGTDQITIRIVCPA